MATTDLKLDEPGTLVKPGPIGRTVRLVFGLLLLWYVAELWSVKDALFSTDGGVISTIWNGVLPGLFLISYVVNIGYSRSWKKWPAIISAGVFLAVGVYGYFVHRSAETSVLAGGIWIWELYLYSHLGLSFLLAAIIATPGCEMRAFHDLFTRLTGVPTKEHYCPVGPLHPVDRWEARR